MFCKRCGKECEPGDLSVTGYCMTCCEEITRQQQAQQDAVKGIPSHMRKAILSILFCCQPFGIVALVFACITNSCIARGDVNGAARASEKAEVWGDRAIFWGIVGQGLLLIFYLFCLSELTQSKHVL